MSKADDIFKKRGFETEVYGKTEIYYHRRINDDIDDFNSFECIKFKTRKKSKNYKTIWCHSLLDMKDLQAINEKCKELGWLDE